MRQKVNESIRPGTENDDGDLPPREILLILDALLHSQKDVKPETLREGEHFSVLPTRKAHLGCGSAIVASQAVLELPRDALVEENDYPS